MNFRRSTYPAAILGTGLALLMWSCAPFTVPAASESANPASQPNSTSPQSPQPGEPVPRDNSQAQSSTAPAPEPSMSQNLPISASAEIDGEVIQLEVAQTPQEQAKGLMYRSPLPDDRGMLFPFNPPRPVQFWMKNTPSPLDMVFLRDGEVQAIVAAAPPCQADPCPTYGPETPVPIDQVLELRSGRAAELGLTVGDRINIQFLN